jgi:hypothetical protein
MVITSVRILIHTFVDIVMQIQFEIVMIRKVHLKAVSFLEIILWHGIAKSIIASLCQLLKLNTLMLEVVVPQCCG